MSNAVLSLPGQVKLTTNIELRVRRLPLGLRTPATFTITAAAPAGTAAQITVGTAADVGATTLAVTALAAALPAFSLLTIGGQALYTSAAAAAAATSITVFPLSFPIAAGTILNFTPALLSIGSNLISVNALPTLIDVGTRLQFGAQTVRVTGRAPAGATQLRVAPLTAAITAGATAITQALLLVVGCMSSPIPSPEPKLVDTTNLLSGIGKEQVVTGVSQTMTVTYELVAGDLGGDEITAIVRDLTQFNRELFFEVRLPDGELHQGVAIVTAAPESGEVQDKRSVQATFQVQGQTYAFTPAPFSFF